MIQSNRVAMIVVVALLSGCGPTRPQTPPINVAIDAISGPDAAIKRTYLLVPGNEGVTVDDLQFREYAAYLRRALDMRGLKPADQPDGAELAIVVNYGIGDPQTISRTVSIPVFGQTGIASSYSAGRITPTIGGGANYSGQTYYTPQYGITGYRQQTQTATYFARYALITAFDWQIYRAERREVQVWRTNLSSAGMSGDLRYIFPIMIGASLPYLRENSGQTATRILRDDDEEVLYVKGLLTLNRTAGVPQGESSETPVPAQPEHVLRILDRKIWGSSRKIYETTTEPPPPSAKESSDSGDTGPK